tara:strand:- start:629 stop:1270 length:642 start_codon:yes stop_codon:yes gene_type:complete
MKKPLAGIINISINNILSIKRALEFVGFEIKIVSENQNIDKFDLIVLPGVGAFNEAMNKLKSSKLLLTVENSIEKNKNFLGICLGMQLLFKKSEEFGNTKGIGYFDGVIENFNKFNVERKTFIGWNKVKFLKKNDKQNIFEKFNLKNNNFYSIHSFFANCKDENDKLATSKNGKLEYTCCVKKNNVTAFQFHPEKSGINGLELLKVSTLNIFN